MWRVVLVVVVGLAGTLGGLAYWKYSLVSSAIAQFEAMPEPAETIQVAKAVPAELQRTIQLSGTVVARRQVTVRNELAGTITQVGFESGTVVEAGDLLLQLDTSAEQADLRAAQARLRRAEFTLARLNKVIKSRAASADEMDQAVAAVDEARANVDRIDADIAKKRIVAPFKARVGLRDVQPGQYLAEGADVTTLQSVEQDAYIDVPVPQAVAAGLREGVSAELSADGWTGTGKISAFDWTYDRNTRQLLTRLLVPDVGLALRPGMRVDVRLPVGEPKSLLALPVGAIRRAPYGDHLYLVQPDEQGKPRARQKFVQVIEVRGDQALLAGGVGPGDQVAAEGAFKLREGVLVNIAQSASTPPEVGQPAASAQSASAAPGADRM